MATGPMIYGQLGSIGATALQLTANTSPLGNGVLIKSMAANSTNKVYVGLVGVLTTTGYELASGESALFAVPDASKLYVIGSTTGLAVSFAAS